MSQFPDFPDDASDPAALGGDATSTSVPTGWPYSLGAPIRANAWGAPTFPQPFASWPSGLGTFAFPFAPPQWPASQSATSQPPRLPDWWIANRSLLGAIPRELNKPVGSDGLLGAIPQQLNKPIGSDGLLGLLAQPVPDAGFFPSSEIDIRRAIANRLSNEWLIPSPPVWPNAPQAVSQPQSGCRR